MAAQETQITTNLNSNFTTYNDLYFISGSDNPGVAIVTPLFNGNNFLQWKKDIRRALGAKNKLGFLNGSLQRPKEDHANYQAWVRCNFLVGSWLLNSMEPEVKADFNYIEDAHEIWSEASERYGQYNGPLVYQLKKEIESLRQDSQTLVSYYSKLKRLWEDLQSVCSMPKCTCGALDTCSCNYVKRMSDFENEEKVMQFLLGLNSVFDSTITSILNMSPIPNLNRAYFLVNQIDKHNEVRAIYYDLNM